MIQLAYSSDREETGQAYSADLSKRRAEYDDYLWVKGAEIDEMRQARHYYHCDQWTEAELRTLKKRNQAPTTHNEIARKINGVVGLLERLKQDPKAYPRTPKHGEGADVATAAVRYVADINEWSAKYPEATRDAATTGIGGIELEIIQGDHGDPDIGLNLVASDLFFYDPRSFMLDFSDARFMGTAKWVSTDLAVEMFPEKADEIRGMIDTGSSVHAGDVDRESKWVNSDKQRIRLVDHWYIEDGEWKWCVYCGHVDLMSGDSYFFDEKGRTACKYIMFSANVDHDGDRYGFFRNMKSLQDEVNHRYSKSLHNLNSRRIKVERGAVNDIEVLRREAARPDGVMEVNKGFILEFEDVKQQADMMAHLKMLELVRNEIDSFGPNPALIGMDRKATSGRAISLMQQAGMAELGPYIVSVRSWKIRVYRAIWNAIQRYWQAERWIRVTDDEGVAQFVQLNGVDIDPMTGFPAIVNGVGSLDVDIILDEGSDSINMQADAFDALSALAQAGERLPPGLLIELAPIQSSVKKKYLEQLQGMSQPNPMQVEGAKAELAEKMASAKLKEAQAVKAISEAQMAGQPMGEQGPSQMEQQANESAANVQDTLAAADLKRAQTAKTLQEIQLAPQKMAQEAQMKREQFANRQAGSR